MEFTRHGLEQSLLVDMKVEITLDMAVESLGRVAADGQNSHIGTLHGLNHEIVGIGHLVGTYLIHVPRAAVILLVHTFQLALHVFRIAVVQLSVERKTVGDQSVAQVYDVSLVYIARTASAGNELV